VKIGRQGRELTDEGRQVVKEIADDEVGNEEATEGDE
jgi:hypothetical protein